MEEVKVYCRHVMLWELKNKKYDVHSFITEIRMTDEGTF